MTILEVWVDGKTIIYDLLDGYTCLDGMRYYLDRCDLYFKRSYSEGRNTTLFTEVQCKKMKPLGLYYIVTSRNNPINESFLSAVCKTLKGKKPDCYFTSDRFENIPQHKDKEKMKIIFCCRLWEESQEVCDASNAERRAINDMRISIIRALRKKYGERFIGGVLDTTLSREMCPDIILPRRMTERGYYIRLMKKCDIGIGSMGLHESIGGKTAEYVAASLAVVNETMHFEVPHFINGKNYLEFDTVEECLKQVDYLMDNPDAVYKMKEANAKFYAEYLREDKLVENSLKAAGVKIDCYETT